jgi:hypothetical protein
MDGDCARGEQKHLVIAQKTGALAKTIKDLKNLADRVCGSTPPEPIEKSKAEAVPTLADVLLSQPERLDGLNAELREQIERLDQALF